MGRLVNGINGAIQGTIGTVVGSSWKGVPYVKARYKKRTTRISKKEKANRSKFAAAQLWLKPLLPFVREGFKGYSERSEGFVAAKSYLLKNAFEGLPPNSTINPALVKLSWGSLSLSDDLAVEKLSNTQLQFSWSPVAVIGGSFKDQVMLLAYAVDKGDAYFTTTGQFRETGEDILTIPPTKNRTYHIYMAFTAADRSRQSDSVYLGTIST